MIKLANYSKFEQKKRRSLIAGAETPTLELVDLQPIILKLEGPFFSVRVHTKDPQYPEIDLVVQRRFLSSLKDEIIEMLQDFPEQRGD